MQHNTYSNSCIGNTLSKLSLGLKPSDQYTGFVMEIDLWVIFNQYMYNSNELFYHCMSGIKLVRILLDFGVRYFLPV